MEIREVAVIGLGTMGAGIVEVFARAGLAVTAIEVDRAALARGMAALDASLSKAEARGRLTAGERDQVLGRVTAAADLAAASADLVVEVVPERMDIKRQVFAELDRACRPEAVLVTNTSSLPVTAIAAGTRHPGRVAGMHFFNPAPVMRMVEVVAAVQTDPATTETLTGLVRSIGKTPVVVTDRAGFVANALLLPYLNHAVSLLAAGYATREDIDMAARVGLGLPMGPLALLDLIGLDTSLAILDRPGFLAGALLYPHLNDAVRMVQDGYASAADVDAAMTLGCGYPRGPLAMLDDIGAGRVHAVLASMHARYGDPAFAPAALLADHATAGLAFHSGGSGQ
jgi:3-hydroxybutyryl-CoA dehydrogenase